MMIGLLMVGIIGTAFYAMFENGTSVLGVNFGDRQSQAVVRQEKTNAERGAFLFARYCRACHGLTGQGSAERPGLPGANLNNPANYPPELTDSQLPDVQQRFSSTIHCGRVGTQMPPWSIEEGGALNFFQIEQLVTLITSKYAPEGWEHMVEVGNEDSSHGGDRLDPPAQLVEALDENDTEFQVTDATAISEDTLIRIGLEELGEEYELLKVVEVDKTTNTVTVERGPDVTLAEALVGSDAMEHEAGAMVYAGPQLPSGQIIGDSTSDATPPCGQNKAAPVNAGGPVDVTDGTVINMNDNFFEVDGETNPQMHVAATTSIGTVLENLGAAAHNFRIAGPDAEYDTDDDIISDPDLIPGGESGAAPIELAAGTYLYRCDFHPDAMLGEVVAE